MQVHRSSSSSSLGLLVASCVVVGCWTAPTAAPPASAVAPAPVRTASAPRVVDDEPDDATADALAAPPVGPSTAPTAAPPIANLSALNGPLLPAPSDNAAADAQLVAIERELAAWDAFAITQAPSNLRDLQNAGRVLVAQRAQVEADLQQLAATFGGAYAMAATVYMGNLDYTYMLKVEAMPMPKFFRTPAAVAAFRQALASNVATGLQTAQRQWSVVVGSGVVNLWSQLAQRNLTTPPTTALPAIRRHP